MSYNQCKHVKGDQSQCGSSAIIGTDFCKHHQGSKNAPLLNEDVRDKNPDFEAYKDVMAKLDDMNAKITELSEENRRLSFAADRGRLAAYDKKNTDQLPTFIGVKRFRDKIVIGWTRLLSNKCEKNEHSVYIEDQRMEVIYEDGTRDTNIPYIEFAKGYSTERALKKNVLVIGDSEKPKFYIDNTPGSTNTVFELELLTGKKISIADIFVN